SAQLGAVQFGLGRDVSRHQPGPLDSWVHAQFTGNQSEAPRKEDVKVRVRELLHVPGGNLCPPFLDQAQRQQPDCRVRLAVAHGDEKGLSVLISQVRPHGRPEFRFYANSRHVYSSASMLIAMGSVMKLASLREPRAVRPESSR